jgi:hypothetical protein
MENDFDTIELSERMVLRWQVIMLMSLSPFAREGERLVEKGIRSSVFSGWETPPIRVG